LEWSYGGFDRGGMGNVEVFWSRWDEMLHEWVGLVTENSDYYGV